VLVGRWCGESGQRNLCFAHDSAARRVRKVSDDF